jgi:transposase
MTQHKRGMSREQTSLLPPSIEDYVAADHPVRVIDVFVEGLDVLGLGFTHATTAATGRPPYHPADLLKVFVYGYLNRVRATRRLEAEAGRNLELMWLIGQLQPDFKTLSTFRRGNVKAIARTCRAFTDFCRTQGLFAAELVAIDGSKFQAVASRKKVWTPERLAKAQARADERIAQYLEELERSEAEDAGPRASPEQVQAALTELKARRDKLDAPAQGLAQSGESQWVQGEPEAKLMRTAQGGHAVAYNAQIAVDSQHKLIVAHEITNEGNDHRQLHPMAVAAKEALQVQELTVVADTGYTHGEQAAQCEADQITPVVPMQKAAHPHGPFFPKGQFTYDRQSDTYRCPAGELLRRIKTDQRQQVHLYGTRACESCALRAQCTGARRRTLNRDFHAAHAEAAALRAAQHPEIMLARHCLAEHPFGNLKWLMGVPRFLLRGLQGARIEMNLSVTAYNLKRVISILGVPYLLAQMKAA